MVCRQIPRWVRVARQVWMPRVLACAATHSVKTSRSKAGGIFGASGSGVKVWSSACAARSRQA